ncbi:MAG: hypothetical protein GX595_18165, partial [Lentisphaerae bacterium]|nr:hypothetical protein [Lentisphaerota bacterium]
QDCLDAIVTGVGPRGADLYLTGIGLFGWLPTPRSAGAMHLGDRLSVRPARIDPVRRDLELMLAPDAAKAAAPPPAPAAAKATKAGRRRNPHGRRRPRKASADSNGRPTAQP